MFTYRASNARSETFWGSLLWLLVKLSLRRERGYEPIKSLEKIEAYNDLIVIRGEYSQRIGFKSRLLGWVNLREAHGWVLFYNTFVAVHILDHRRFKRLPRAAVANQITVF